jgi:uncharacterized protein YbjT (DUF2867 family)
MNTQKTILILGATGPVGQPVSYALKEAGFRVRIMTRDLQKARKFFDGSFEMVAGDPTDPSCLEEAMHGCFGVHISLPTEVEQQVAETVAKVASKHGVERITYISGATVAEENRWFPMIDRKFLAEKAIREGGTPYTIFCPTWVMEILPMFVNQGRATVLGKQPYPYHWVAAADIARMVSTAYALGEGATGRVIVHGPEAFRMDEALRRYCAAFHPEIKQVTGMPFWLVKLLATVTGNQALKGAGELMAYLEKVGEGTSKPKIDGVFSAPAITLDQWLERRKSVTFEHMGKAIVDPRFSKIDGSTHQAPDHNTAANRVVITATSGAGNVTVDTK